MRSRSSRSAGDRILVASVATSAAAAGAVVLLILAFVLRESLPALREVGAARFLAGETWQPAHGRFGLAPMLAATALVATGALLVATPLGVLAAVFRRFFAPPALARWYRRMIELLAGIPSVVFGLWGLVTVVPILAAIEPPGASLLAGVVVLALMVLPTIALTADAALGAVPAAYLRGGAALGLGRASIATRIALPAARRGIGAGVVLASGRAIGETMAVLMVCGNVVQVPSGPFDPVRTITANIALEMGYATEEHRSVLFVSGLALIAAIAVLVAAAELLAGRRARA